MKFALSGAGEKIAPTKRARGICPLCGEEVHARCGTKYVHHWAHLSGSDCDPWSSSETQWHRKWKNQFPELWQEITCISDCSSEIHRADVKTDSGLVLEFQHSKIEEPDKLAREHFYKDMFWIVDLSKKIERKKILKAQLINNKFTHNRLVCKNAAEIFPEEWLNRNSIVIFDYLGLEEQSEGSIYNDLFCIIPSIGKKLYAYILIVNRNEFIEGIKKGTFNFAIKSYTRELNNILIAEQKLLTGEIQIRTQRIVPKYRRIRRSRHL
ncbi:MAG: hypothetical protein II929_07880 [Succinivibrio sp.]|nr:hypothetical protein [Succinivibrio sp.]